MAVYSTDFSEYGTGSEPSDWSFEWDSESGDWTVEAGAGLGSQQLESDPSGSPTEYQSAMSWDDVGSPMD